MSAFNWIEFEELCPHCGETRRIRAQTHVASSYDGDESGRFQDDTYSLQDKMRWWRVGHADFEKWKDGNRKVIEGIDDREVFECCHASCMSCAGEIYAVIRFVDCAPVEVVEFGPEEDWPDSYWR